jgi:hypothetical protein
VSATFAAVGHKACKSLEFSLRARVQGLMSCFSGTFLTFRCFPAGSGHESKGREDARYSPLTPALSPVAAQDGRYGGEGGKNV